MLNHPARRIFGVMKLVAFWGMLVLIIPAVNAEPDNHTKWEGIEHMMSTREFRAAGLDKLSPEELRQLDQWLVHFLAYDSQQVVRADDKIKKLQNKAVQHRIPGHFSGWTGKTIFTLDNGEVWRQRLPGIYKIKLENPVVEISKNLFGYYELRLVKTGRKIGVSRVK